MQVTHPKISEYGAEEWKRERALDKEIRNTNWGVDVIWWGWCCANMREILGQNEEVRAESRARELKVCLFVFFLRRGRGGWGFIRDQKLILEIEIWRIFTSLVVGWLCWDPHALVCFHSNSSISLSLLADWKYLCVCLISNFKLWQNQRVLLSLWYWVGFKNQKSVMQLFISLWQALIGSYNNLLLCSLFSLPFR